MAGRAAEEWRIPVERSPLSLEGTRFEGVRLLSAPSRGRAIALIAGERLSRGEARDGGTGRGYVRRTDAELALKV
jgi:hypothetical protein